MKTLEELDALAKHAPPWSRQGEVRLICLRLGGGRHQLSDCVEVTPESGVIGDRWKLADDPQRLCQVTLINASIGAWIAHGDVPPEAAGDNFHVELDLSERTLPVGARVELGTALLEVSAEPHLGCRLFRQRFGAEAMRWVNHPEHRQERRRGINLRVLSPGVVRVGDVVRALGA